MSQEQYTALVGRVDAPNYSSVFTPEVESQLPIEASAEERVLTDWEIFGNDEPNSIDQSEGAMPLAFDTNGGAAKDWRIDGNNVPQVENKTGILPLTIPSNGDNLTDYTIYGNNNPVTMEYQKKLSMDVSATAGNAKDWEIYGNNDPGVENKTGDLPIEVSAKGGNAFDWVIEGNDDNGTENLFDINTSTLVQIDTQGTMRFGASVGALKAGTYTLSFDKDSSTFSIWIVERKGTTYTQSNSIASSPYTFTLSTDADEVMVRTSYQAVTTWEALGLTNIMLVPGSTAPDHYIPYQQGVGENTEITGELPIDFRSNGDDLLGYKIYGTADEAGVQTENLVDVSASTLVPINTTDYRFGVSLGKLDAGNYVLSFVNNSAYTLYITKRTGTSYTQSSAILTSPFTFSVGDNVDEVYLRTTRTQAGSPSMWAEMGFTDIIINAGSTAPTTHIPYGYQIPLTISKQGQPDKTVNIYIGDSKLGEEEYVDYGEQKIYKRILFMTYDDKHFITKDNKDFCLRRTGYSG